MNKLKIEVKIIPWIIIGILIVLLFLQRSCTKPCPDQKIIHDTITIIKYDTIIDSTYLPKPIPVQTIKPKPIEVVPSNKSSYYDTIECNYIKDMYYTTNIYYRILKDDSIAYIALRDSVKGNSLQQSELYYQNRRPTMINNINSTQTIKQRNKIFVGVSIGRSIDSFTLGPSLMLITKRDAGYSIMYDVFNKDIYGTLYYKIKFKK